MHFISISFSHLLHKLNLRTHYWAIDSVCTMQVMLLVEYLFLILDHPALYALDQGPFALPLPHQLHTTMDRLQQMFAQFRVPGMVVTVNGASFTSTDFEFLEVNQSDI